MLKLFWVGVSGASYQPPTHHSLSVWGKMLGVVLSGRQLLKNEEQYADVSINPDTEAYRMALYVDPTCAIELVSVSFA